MPCRNAIDDFRSSCVLDRNIDTLLQSDVKDIRRKSKRKTALWNDAFDIGTEAKTRTHGVEPRVTYEDQSARKAHAAIHGFQYHLQNVVERKIAGERLGDIANAGGQHLLRVGRPARAALKFIQRIDTSQQRVDG